MTNGERRTIFQRVAIVFRPRRAKPIRLDIARLGVGAHGRDQQAARLQPAGDSAQQPGVFLARQVDDRVERRDRVEASRWEIDRRHIGMDESRRWNIAPRQLDVPGRDVDAGHVEALGQRGRGRDARAAAKIEHCRAGGQPVEQLGGIACARRFAPCRPRPRAFPRLYHSSAPRAAWDHRLGPRCLTLSRRRGGEDAKMSHLLAPSPISRSACLDRPAAARGCCRARPPWRPRCAGADPRA